MSQNKREAEFFGGQFRTARIPRFNKRFVYIAIRFTSTVAPSVEPDSITQPETRSQHGNNARCRCKQLSRAECSRRTAAAPLRSFSELPSPYTVRSQFRLSTLPLSSVRSRISISLAGIRSQLTDYSFGYSFDPAGKQMHPLQGCSSMLWQTNSPGSPIAAGGWQRLRRLRRR